MSLEQRIRESLRQPLEGDRAAEERAWRVIGAAPRTPERKAPLVARWKPLASLAATIAVVAVALTPPGEAVSDWLREGLGIDGEERPATRARLSLPAGGHLLVTAPRGTWVVRRDGSRRRIGEYEEASWSPNGLFVTATAGDQLVALTPEGEVRWARSSGRATSRPRWSPSGLRIAYLSGRDLRLVSGAGRGDGRLARGVAPVAPAWRPRGADELAFVDGRGRIVLVSAVTGAVLWRSPPENRPFALAWSHDGRRLAAVGRTGVRLLDGAGRSVGGIRPARGAELWAAAASPRERRIALLERRAGESAVVLASLNGGAGPRVRVFAGTAPLEDLAWSPNGRWILATSPRADQWLFLRTHAPNEVVARSGVTTRFDPGRGADEFPRLAGWCCAP